MTSQVGNLPQIGVKTKTYLKTPPSCVGLVHIKEEQKVVIGTVPFRKMSWKTSNLTNFRLLLEIWSFVKL